MQATLESPYVWLSTRALSGLTFSDEGQLEFLEERLNAPLAQLEDAGTAADSTVLVRLVELSLIQQLRHLATRPETLRLITAELRHRLTTRPGA